MKRIKGIIVLVLLLALVASPAVILASDISASRYYGTIIVSNNSTATTNVAVNCTISTQALIDGGYLNSSANNCVVRSSAGADLPFMPSVNASYSWMIWVASIGQNTHLADILYTANSSGGEIRYFPAGAGMTTTDNETMELGDNFTVEQKGWVDTSYTDNKTLIYKKDAFRTYISGTGNITSEIAYWVSPTGDIDPDGAWANEGNAYDENTATFAVDNVPATSWSSFIILTRAAMNCDAIRWWSRSLIPGADEVDVDVFYDGTWQDVYEGVSANEAWVEKSLGASHSVNGTRWRWYNSQGGATDARLHEFDFIATVTASGVSSGEYTITTSANTTHLWIEVDGVEADNITLAGASVPDNANDWFYYTNMSNYWDYTEITIDGVQVQYIDWEYDTIFYDSSGFDNDATPTFRTTSSDPDVSAVLNSFLPITEAKAPAYALAEAPAFIETVPTIVSEWDVVPPAGTFPLAGVIAAIASATDTPAQLPLLIIAAFIILAVSLSISTTMRKYGSGSLIVKVIAITAVMGVFIGIGNFGVDFWMLFVFLIIAVALMMASRHTTWN